MREAMRYHSDFGAVTWGKRERGRRNSERMGREKGTWLTDFGEKRVGMVLRNLGFTKGYGYRTFEAKQREGGEGGEAKQREAKQGHGVQIYILGGQEGVGEGTNHLTRIAVGLLKCLKGGFSTEVDNLFVSYLSCVTEEKPLQIK